MRSAPWLLLLARGEIVQLRCNTRERGFTDPAYIFPNYTDTLTIFAKKKIKKLLFDQTNAIPTYRHSPEAPAHIGTDHPNPLLLKTLPGPGTSYAEPRRRLRDVAASPLAG